MAPWGCKKQKKTRLTKIENLLMLYVHRIMDTFKYLCVCIYKHACMHACMHAYLPAYLPTYLPTYLQIDIQAYRHTDIRTHSTVCAVMRWISVSTYKYCVDIVDIDVLINISKCACSWLQHNISVYSHVFTYIIYT